MVNLLCSSNINYKVIYKSTFTENYMQSNNNKKLIKYFLPIVNINKIDIYVIGIKKHFICPKVYFIYLIQSHFIPHLGQRYFNILKIILYIKKWAISLLIILNRSVMTQKKLFGNCYLEYKAQSSYEQKL